MNEMNATELFHADGKSAGIWYCAKCRVVARSREDAEQCCQPRKCECGSEVERGWICCNECRRKKDVARERERFEKAEKLTEWDGWVFCGGIGSDGFSESLEDFYDNWADEHDGGGELPEYVWACKENHLVHADIAIENFDLNELDGLPELKAAINTFVGLNKDKISYEPDYTKAVLTSKKDSQ